MNGLFGIRDPRQRFGGPAMMNQRQTIPTTPPREMAQQMPQGLMGGGQMSPSQGLFQLYMKNLFKQRYAPPVMPGGVQQFPGYRGFGSPQMPAIQRPQSPGLMDPNVSPGGTPWHIYNQA